MALRAERKEITIYFTTREFLQLFATGKFLLPHNPNLKEKFRHTVLSQLMRKWNKAKKSLSWRKNWESIIMDPDELTYKRLLEGMGLKWRGNAWGRCGIEVLEQRWRYGHWRWHLGSLGRLRQGCKLNGIRGYSNKTRAQLITLLMAV